MRTSVVLPDPFGPTITHRCHGSTTQSTSRRIHRPSRTTPTPDSASAGTTGERSVSANGDVRRKGRAGHGRRLGHRPGDGHQAGGRWRGGRGRGRLLRGGGGGGPPGGGPGLRARPRRSGGGAARPPPEP